MSDQPLLQLDDVSKFYGSITALDRRHYVSRCW